MRPTALLALLTLTACASREPPRAQFVHAEPLADPPRGTTVIEIPKPMPLPGQLKRMPVPRARGARLEKTTPSDVIDDANRKAASGPDTDGYFNAIMTFDYAPGALYQVYAAPLHLTSVQLQPGEKILGKPAAGDTIRWVMGIARSGPAGGDQQQYLYIKPTRAGLNTTIAINTDRRTYYLELHSYENTYMAAVQWRYPHDELEQLEASASARRSSWRGHDGHEHQPRRDQFLLPSQRGEGQADLDSGAGVRRRSQDLRSLPRLDAHARGAGIVRPVEHERDPARELQGQERLLHRRSPHRPRRAPGRPEGPRNRSHHTGPVTAMNDDTGLRSDTNATSAPPSTNARSTTGAQAGTGARGATDARELTDLHRTKVPADDPRLKLERPKFRTLRRGPALAAAAILAGVFGIALIVAITPSTPSADEAKKSAEAEVNSNNTVALPDMLRDQPGVDGSAPRSLAPAGRQTLTDVSAPPLRDDATPSSAGPASSDVRRQARSEEFARARGASIFAAADDGAGPETGSPTEAPSSGD